MKRKPKTAFDFLKCLGAKPLLCTKAEVEHQRKRRPTRSKSGVVLKKGVDANNERNVETAVVRLEV